MEPALFEKFRKLVYDHAGIELQAGKEVLVSARISGRLRALGITQEAEYLELLSTDPGCEEMTNFLDVISTNFTHFFREPGHFELLAEECATAVAAGQPEFRVWCAASSSGEEPYSLAMVLEDRLAHHHVDWRLLATDISTRVLAAAQKGVYSAEAVKPVPEPLRSRFLQESGTSAEVVESLREKVKFARLNLARPPYPMRGPFDVVFCRNVMIYFDTKVRQGLVTQVERLLRPGGLLVVGHTETLHAVSTGLETVSPSVYRKPRTR